MSGMMIEVSKENVGIEMLTSMLQVLEHLENKNDDSMLDLDVLWKEMKRVEEKHPNEYSSFDLANVSLAYLIPLMKQRLSNSWRPFDSKSSDDSCRSIFLEWRPLLEHRSPATHRYKAAIETCW